jgi:bifunctional non-homologous end joining protein LigD
MDESAAQFDAFDVLGGHGEVDALPVAPRKAGFARLLSFDGIFIAENEEGEFRVVLFGTSCNMGLEGIVLKRLGRAYAAGYCAHWIKVKNPAHLASRRSGIGS